MKIEKWDKSKFGKLTFENICRLFSSDKQISLSKEPPFTRSFNAVDGKNEFVIRWNSFEPTADFSGESFRDCNYYVLKGNCEIKVDKLIVRLKKGDWFEFPKGKYEFKVIGEDAFEYVAVYKLLHEFTNG